MKNDNLIVIKLEQVENLRVYGRTIKEIDSLPLFWTGSGIEVNAKCSELWIDVECDYDEHELWISILVNDVAVSRMMLLKGRQWICVFRNMNPEVIKNVKVIRDVQAMNGDPLCSLKIHNLKCDGEFMPLKDKKYKIEFIGDSITSGEGAIGAKEEEDWISMWFSAVDNYAYLTSKLMDADFRIVSQSGWGVLCGYDNNPHSNLCDNYEKVCGVLEGEQNEKLGAFLENDFNSWQPDAVVVNLGTNDCGAFNSPAYIDEKTGEVFKMRLNDDDTYNEEDIERFEDAVEKFLLKIRRYNKNAHIVWAYGMLGMEMMPYIYHAVESYKKNNNDINVSVFQLPNVTKKTMGARNHPGLRAHKKAAKELSDYLINILNKRNK